jgi:hypothetical protein
MEYLTVDPKYRKGTAGYSMASLIIGLGYEVLKASSFDATMGPARCDVKIDEKVSEFGAFPLRETFTLHGVPVRIMVTLRDSIRRPSDSLIGDVVADHWARRNQDADIPPRSIPQKKIAA